MFKSAPCCMICSERSERFLSISDNFDGQKIESILMKHFWFKTADCQNQFVCCSCWKRISDFHQLYCAVETRWFYVKPALLFRCEECDHSKAFSTETDLQLHTLLLHSKETDKVHNCDQCDKSFATEWQLSSHKAWHQDVDNLNISCNVCNKQFASMHTRNAHVRNQHSDYSIANMAKVVMTHEEDNADSMLIATTETEKETAKKIQKSAETIAQEDELIRQFCNLSCKRCEYVGDNLYQLLKHYTTDHQMRGYAECCGIKFTKKPRLYNHCQLHVNPNMFQCEICSKTFSQSEALEQHNQWVHTPDSAKPFKCDICDAAFCKSFQLRFHMKYHIAKEQKIFQCKDCNKSFGTNLLLQAHRHNHHGAFSNWACDICGKGFTHKALLEKHYLLHSEQGAASLMVQCGHCSKWLKNKDTYQSHVKRCLASGSITCDVCGKKLANEPALARHKRVIHRHRPMLACSYCGKAYKEIRRLREHEANHRGVVLYTCPYCPKTSNSSSTMHNHKKSAHPEQFAARRAEQACIQSDT
ncbi:transcription factor grauzone-like [Topomyia yanbarensis]|uniref:transcription factor grauzone-like n=1 Tax=Topomyia yanbarensis TaxID=2498891 RepID=UPI00273CE0DD|nr:transcription factor grauzone-like [Topomyia yanbarensis]